MGYVLRSVRGRKQGLAIPVKKKVFLIGSSPKSHIRSRKEGVGPQHCALVPRKRKLYIQDLRSGCPTQVNGLTVTPGARMVLKKGDRVAVGPMEFVIELRRRRKKASVLVSAPFAAPPVPVGLPVNHRPSAVPVTEALASPFLPPIAPFAPPRESNAWTLAAVAALAVVGLGLGVLVSRAFVGGAREEQTANHDQREKKDDTRMARREDRALQQGQNGQGAKGAGERSVTPSPALKDLKEQDKQPVKPAVDETPKKPDAGTGGKKSDKGTPPEAAKKPEPTPDPTKDNPVKNRVAFAEHVQPILQARCINCHGTAKKKGGLDVTSIASMLKGGETGPAIIAGDPTKSPLWMRVDDDSMPPAGKPLTMAEKKALQDWIAGASNGTFTK